LNEACRICRGACCRFVMFPITVSENDKEWLEFHNGIKQTDMIEISIPCRHLTDGKCSIYKTRPNICRKAEPGDSVCIRSIKKFCPEKLTDIRRILDVNKKHKN